MVPKSGSFEIESEPSSGSVPYVSQFPARRGERAGNRVGVTGAIAENPEIDTYGIRKSLSSANVLFGDRHPHPGAKSLLNTRFLRDNCDRDRHEFYNFKKPINPCILITDFFILRDYLLFL
jgi:hypothetical protein